MDQYIVLESGSEFLLTAPDTNTDTVVVFLPGMSGGAMSERFLPLSRACVEAGLAIARVSIWNDANMAGKMSLVHIHEQLAEVINHLRSLGYQRCIGIGKSFGGAVLLTYPVPEFEKLVLWAPAIGCGEEVGNLEQYLHTPLEEIGSILDLKIGITDLGSKDLPVALIHGTADITIPYSNSESLCADLPQAILLPIAGADHSYKEPEHERLVIAASIAHLK